MARTVKRARKAKSAKKAKSGKTAKKAAVTTNKKKSKKKVSRIASATPKNRAILASLIGGNFPDDQELAPLGFDDIGSKQTLAAQIRARGVPVSTTAIVLCEKVGEVLNVMDHPPRGT